MIKAAVFPPSKRDRHRILLNIVTGEQTAFYYTSYEKLYADLPHKTGLVGVMQVLVHSRKSAATPFPYIPNPFANF